MTHATEIRTAVENVAQSFTEYRHSHKNHSSHVLGRPGTTVEGLGEARAIANYWETVYNHEIEVFRNLLQQHGPQIQRLYYLAEARYVQMCYPDDYKEIEHIAAPWRRQQPVQAA